MDKIKNHGKKWFYWFTLGITLIIVYHLLNQFSNIADIVEDFFKTIAPILSGIFIAYLLYLPCRKFEKMYKKSNVKIIQKKARAFSIITVYVIAILFISIIVIAIIPILIDSTVELVTNLQTYIEDIIQKYQELDSNSFWKSEFISNIINGVREIEITKFVNPTSITEYAKEAIGMITGIFNSFVAVVVSIYVLSERDSICNFFKRAGKAFLKSNAYKGMEKYFNNANLIFSQFLTSQILDAIIVGIISIIILSLLGIKYAPLLGFIIGVFNIIPYIGAIIGVGIASIITLITGGLSQAIWMLIVIIIFQQIDANIINPNIVGNSLKVSPLLVIVAVSIGGAYWGVLGMFVAVPICAVIKILAEDYIEFKIKTKNKEKAIE